jgi:hypothetical protein
MSAFVVFRDLGDGPVEIGIAATLDAAMEQVGAIPADMVRITDAVQLVFLASVLDDSSLRLVVAWEPQSPEDGSVGVFARDRAN